MLSAGSYWLTLSGATGPDFTTIWDTSNGPSSAFDAPYFGGAIPSESFQILGTPEPGSFTLLDAGLLAAGVWRRKLRLPKST